jgi:argininosuccinate synthase
MKKQERLEVAPSATNSRPRVKKVVLAYSGGLDTSVIVPWLKNNYGCDVVCMCANLGQEEELDGLEAKALASGVQ